MLLRIFGNGGCPLKESFRYHALYGIFPTTLNSNVIASSLIAEKKARTLPSSNYPIAKLSPVSQKVRVNKTIIERKDMSHKFSKLQPFDCEVNEKQSAELLQIVSEIDTNGSKVINELIEEGDRVVGRPDNILREAWH